mgnify:CR=1 FL=1
MSLEQYKNANRKELWEILQIQADEIKKLEDDQLMADSLITELYKQTFSIEHMNDKVKLLKRVELYNRVKSYKATKAGMNQC